MLGDLNIKHIVNLKSLQLLNLNSLSNFSNNFFNSLKFSKLLNNLYLPTLCKLSLYSSVSPLPKATIITLFLPKKNLEQKRQPLCNWVLLNIFVSVTKCSTTVEAWSQRHYSLLQGLKKNPLWAKVNLFYILLTCYARIKVEALTCCVSTQSERLLVCYSSYSPQKIWTSICRYLRIFVTEKTKQWLFSSEKHINSSSSPHCLAHTVVSWHTERAREFTHLLY